MGELLNFKIKLPFNSNVLYVSQLPSIFFCKKILLLFWQTLIFSYSLTALYLAVFKAAITVLTPFVISDSRLNDLKLSTQKENIIESNKKYISNSIKLKPEFFLFTINLPAKRNSELFNKSKFFGCKKSVTRIIS